MLSKNLLPKVTKKEIGRRSKVLRKISEDKFTQFYKKNIGNEKEIIIEKIKKIDDKFTYSGITDNYLQISFNSGEKYKKGDLIKTILK